MEASPPRPRWPGSPWGWWAQAAAARGSATSWAPGDGGVQGGRGAGGGGTAIQMDNKLGSLPRAVLGQALEQARRGRLHILAEMGTGLPAPRADLKANAPG